MKCFCVTPLNFSAVDLVGANCQEQKRSFPRSFVFVGVLQKSFNSAPAELTANESFLLPPLIFPSWFRIFTPKDTIEKENHPTNMADHDRIALTNP